jgi:hypothetical protein
VHIIDGAHSEDISRMISAAIMCARGCRVAPSVTAVAVEEPDRE